MQSLLGPSTSLAITICIANLCARTSHAQDAPNPGAGAPSGGAPAPVPSAGPSAATPPTAILSVLPPPTPPPGAVSARKWYDAVKVEGFVDAYASVNANSPKPQTGTNLGRAFDVTNGFALHWVGLNASYAPEPVGATVGLRFGPGAFLYNAGPDADAGLAYVKQAFIAWKPVEGLPVELDFGKFDTWIGAETADSQYDMTYTRSALFTTQPLFHTGLRIDVAASDQVDVKLYAVNGYNNSIDNNAMKTFGATVALTPLKEVGVYVNYIGGPEQADVVPDDMGGRPVLVRGANGRWRHLVDVVADLKFGHGRALVNADYGTEKLAAGTLAASDPEKSVSWFGANVTLGYAVTDVFAFALRGGYLVDADGYLAPLWGAPAGQKASVVDGTLTLSVTPTPNLVIRLEPRLDAVASDQSGWEGGFPKAPDAPAPGVSKTLFTATVGVVATTN